MLFKKPEVKRLLKEIKKENCLSKLDLPRKKILNVKDFNINELAKIQPTTSIVCFELKENNITYLIKEAITLK